MNADARVEWDLVGTACGVIAAHRGEARDARARELAAHVVASGNGDATVLACDFDEAGAWGGLGALLEEIVPSLMETHPTLVLRHDYEIAIVAPRLRRKVGVRNPSLTDTSEGDEAVRNYAMGRAYRIVNGLVDLIAAWRATRAPEKRWTLVCLDVDRAGDLMRRFVRELARRKADAIGLSLLAWVSPEAAGDVVGELAPFGASRVDLDLPQAPPRPAARADAEALEKAVAEDAIEREARLHELLCAWEASDTPERGHVWYVRALSLYNHYGLYAEARRCGERIVPHLDALSGGDEEARWNILGNLFHARVATGGALRALDLVEAALPSLTRPEFRLRAAYVLAMLHARYLPERDYPRAEALLRGAMTAAETLDVPAGKKAFLSIFVSNGLAFVVHRLGRPEEALALCRAGVERLQAELGPERHRLHRSVLLFNAGQVLMSLGAHDEAIAHFTSAMAIDPNYSEYYNDRGNARVRSGRLELALGDYCRAIDLSPPYAEVRANMGECLRLLGRFEDALAAFDGALDLEPANPIALQGKAHAYEALGRVDDALDVYAALLPLAADRAAVLATRATLLFDAGRAEECVADLDGAIALAPERADLYFNRAYALEAMGRRAEGARDLRRYLEAAPHADDRRDVERKLEELEAA